MEEKGKVVYLLKIFGLSILLFSFAGSLLKTNDGTISYFLSLLSSIFIIKELDNKH